MAEEVFPWLKSLPLAPEFHPTVTEFQDPISYISKIEEEASRYGICKIIPPVSASSKKTVISNLNRSLSAVNPNSSPTFTTRHQQIGFSPQKHQRPVQRSVWESGVYYTPSQFELKAKKFENSHLKKVSIQKRVSSSSFTPLELETLFWKAQVDKPFTVEYGNDMMGSAFDETGAGGGGVKQGKKEVCDVMTVGESEWNMRRVARANGSLLRFLKEEIPGVTSPMVYLGMLFSWFAWHVEDHDFHSLNYMHMGGGKTWYGVPMEAAFAFEDVVRMEGYGGEISPTVTFATLGGKTTIMSPEVLVKAGVPCCRLVQNPGEFVVTFPRAYHLGFSLGFNCAEATNFATPGWLRVARESTIRRVSIDWAPMVSKSQLLYDLAMSLCLSKQKSNMPEPQSSRLKERMQIEGDAFVKRTFMQDVMHNNELLYALGNGSPVTLLSEDILKSLVTHGLNLHVGPIVNRRSKKRLYCSYDQPNKKANPASLFSCVTCGSPCYSCVAIVQPSKAAAHYLMSHEDLYVMNPRFSSSTPNGVAAFDKVILPKRAIVQPSEIAAHYLMSHEDVDVIDPRSSSSTPNGVTRFGKVILSKRAIVQPSETAAHYLMSNEDVDFMDPQFSSSTPNGVAHFDKVILPKRAIVQPSETTAHYFMSNEDVDVMDPGFASGELPKSSSTSEEGKDTPAALDLLALAYGDSSDSEEASESTNIAMESNRSLGAYHRKPSLIGSGPLGSPCERDSSRMHVFCLEHALEVEQRFRPVGGVNLLLLCHQDYQEMNDAARLVGKELGISDDMWTDVGYIDITEQDKELLQWALDEEETATGKQDWAVRLGIDIFHSAKLGRSPSYKKQMPYNSVIYNAFRQFSTSNDVLTPKQSDSPTTNSFVWQKTGKDRNVDDKKGRQESDIDFATRSSKRKIVCKRARKHEVWIKSKPKKNQNLSKKGKEGYVVATSDDEEGLFDCRIGLWIWPTTI